MSALGQTRSFADYPQHVCFASDSHQGARTSQQVRNVPQPPGAHGTESRIILRRFLRSSAYSRGASSRDCFQIVPHDRASRCAASNLLEARPRESSGSTGKSVRRAFRCARVDRISFERRRPRAFCGLQGCNDKLRHDPLPAITPAHKETGDCPDGHIVHRSEPPHAIKPR